MSGCIVLIGMAGSGKTTLGRELARRLNRPFVDVDVLIEQRYGKIADLFDQGEATFRQCETEALREVCETPRAVIATGGGVVTVPGNMDLLEAAGTILFVDRPIDKIVMDIDFASRPLFVCGIEALNKAYQTRLPLYRRYADYTIDNSGSVDDACERVLELVEEGKL